MAALNFPRRAVTYREDIVALWADCMRQVIEKTIASAKYQQAEEQCKHLLIIVPEDEFGLENLEKAQRKLHPKKDLEKTDADEPAAAAEPAAS